MAKIFNRSKNKIAQVNNFLPQTDDLRPQRDEPQILNCICGNRVVLEDTMTNTCEQCGREYNGSGQELADRSQWGEETGETFAAKKPFNLSKMAQSVMPPMDPMGLNDSVELNEPIDPNEANMVPNDMPKFKDGSDLKLWLDQQNDAMSAREQLINVVDISAQEELESYIDQYYQGGLEENTKLQLTTNMFDMLVPDAKQLDPNDPSMVPAQFAKGSVEMTNQIIKEMATKAGQNKKASAKSYNLSKTAQHKGFDNVIMFGPNQMRVDPFLRQPVSNYALLERNKGFGLVIDDIWDIDYESIWRSTIMDKYSRSYKDKDGQWVGGYINKRFEVDRNVPDVNNMQLKPGQKRKPILPAYGLIEGRMELQREENSKKSASGVFNLKTAMSKKKSELKISQLKPLKELRFPGEPEPAKWGRVCKGCGGTVASLDPSKENNSDYCQNCQNAGVANQAGSQPTGANKRRPNYKGERNYNPYSTNKPISVQPGQVVASTDKTIVVSSLPEMDKKDDATKDKKRVNDVFISDDFKMCPNIQTKKPKYVDNNEEITKSCEDLAIDG